MKFNERDMEDLAEKALRSCLEAVPFLKIEAIQKQPRQNEAEPDYVLRLGLPKGEKTLLIEAKVNGQPRWARQAVNQLLRYRGTHLDTYAVFIAPYISPQSQQICQQEGVGTIDLAGNCHLCFDLVYIRQEGRPNPFATKRDLRSLYSPKAARILRVLLSNPKRGWKVQELAKEAAVSLGQVSNTKKLLADREWILPEAEGIRLSDPETLLTEWAENYSYRRNRVQDFYTLKSTAEVEAELAKFCTERGIQYVLTSFSGAARLAPSVRYQRVFAYFQEPTPEILAELNLKEVSSGANVTLLTPYDDGVFYGSREIGDVKIASPVQIYLDLVSYRGRGAEAAATLLELVIRPTW